MPFDYAIVGGGTAGAVLAARLSERPSVRVLLLEAGADWRSADAPPELRAANWALLDGFRSETDVEEVDGQGATEYLQGRGLGGGGTINAQGAMRGVPSDYDGWGVPGWTWAELLQAFVRLERDLDFGDRDYHGDSGPTPVSRWREQDWGAVSRGLAAAAVALGHEPHEDLNAPDSVGVSAQPWHRDARGRVTANDAYLEPARGRASLEIRGDSAVERIELAGGRAVGVRVGGELVEAGEVVLCAGALESPRLLLRSGIEHPAIGANLHDHPIASIGIELERAARPSSVDVPVAATFVRWQEQGVDDVAICPLDIRGDDPRHGGLRVALLQPHSRGRLTLDSARLRMLAEPEDRARMRAAVRHAAELLRHDALARIGRADLSFAELGDAELDGWLREHTSGFVHAAGTCALGEVVDADCRVHGVEGLRVVDASILPSLPRAAPYLTVLAVAELAAARILGNT